MSAPKTGIGAIDNTAKWVDNRLSEAGNGINNVGSQAGNAVNRVSDLKNVTEGIRDVVAGAARNVERNVNNHFTTLGMAFKGDFTAADNSLINAFITSNGPGLFANPDDIDTISGTENLATKKEKQANDAAADVEAKNVANARENTMQDIRDVISGQIGARMRSPGRSSTLLGVGLENPTILTLNRGR